MNELIGCRNKEAIKNERGGSTMHFLIASFFGYLFGCINGSQLIGKYKNVSIKQSGMKNAGATNTTLLLGWKFGIMVAFIDIFKAIISLAFIAFILNHYDITFAMKMLFLYVNGLFVIIGHNYPVTMKFNGGKGTASLFGVLLFIDWKLAVTGFIILVLFALVSNYFVAGTFMLYIAFIGFTAYAYGKAPTYIALLFLLLFFIKHTENVKRILRKEEVKVSTLFQREAS